MGLFDKVTDMAADAADKLDDVEELVEEHADKLPGGLGDKVNDAIDKVGDLADKLPGKD